MLLLWGDEAFQEPLTRMTYYEGLDFSLANDASDLPLLQHTNELLKRLVIKPMLEEVAAAEANLGGRFTDDIVLHLTLAFSIQLFRIKIGRYVDVEAATSDWLETKNVWAIAVEVAQSFGLDLQEKILLAETSYIAMHFLAGTRHHVWPGDLYVDPALTDLISVLMKEVAQAFSVTELSHDPSLRDGLFAHIIPAIMRQRFSLWTPPAWSDGRLSRKYRREYNIARELSKVILEQTSVMLPNGEIDTLTLLLRAAFIRERPYHAKRVFIVCPSGMATAQLLVARLKPQFPSLEIAGVISLRELSPDRIVGAHFLISTVPVEDASLNLPVIQVHPLLYPEDVEAITNYLLS